MAAKGLLFTIRGRNDAAAAVNSFNSGLDRVRSTTSKMLPAQSGFNKGLSENRRAIQQVGFQLSDFAIQIAGGQNAMLAFTQQGGQVLQFFGPFGAVAGALLAIFGSLAIAFVKSGQGLAQLTPIVGVLRNEFQMIFSVMRQLGSAFIDFANLIVNNLDVILISVSVLAGYMAGKWFTSWLLGASAVARMASAVATSGAVTMANVAVLRFNYAAQMAWNTSLVTSTAIIGSFTAWLSRMALALTWANVRMVLLTVALLPFTVAIGVASFAVMGLINVMSLMAGAIARFVVGIGSAVVSLIAFASQGVTSAIFGLYTMISGFTLASLSAFAHATAVGVVRVAVFSYTMVTNIGALATNLFAASMTAGAAAGRVLVASLVALRGILITLGIGAILIALGYLIERFMRLIEVSGGFAGALQRVMAFGMAAFDALSFSAQAMGDGMGAIANYITAAFLNAFSFIGDAWNGMMGGMEKGYNYLADKVGGSPIDLSAWDLDISGLADTYTAAGDRGWDSMVAGFDLARDTIAAGWSELTAGMTENPIDVGDWFGGATGGGATGGGATGGGSPADAIAEEARRIKEIFEDISSSISKSLLTGFKAVLNGTSNLKTFALDALSSILDKAQDLLLSPIFDMIGGYVADSMVGLFGAPVYPSKSFAGGGHTGNAARSGGLDGKGGFSAILHPRERVIDETTTSGGSAGASNLGTVTLLVSESSSFMSTIETTSDKVAVKRISEYDRTTLPGSVQRVNSNGRVR